MQRLIALLRWTVFGVLAIVAAIAMVENRQPLTLEFLGFRTAELPVYWWLVIAFAFGGLCGWLVTGIGLVRARAGARRAEAELARSRAAQATPQRSGTDAPS